MKHRKPRAHFCNCELRCPECIQHFWIWYENHTQGRSMRRRPGSVGTERTFYESATSPSRP